MKFIKISIVLAIVFSLVICVHSLEANNTRFIDDACSHFKNSPEENNQEIAKLLLYVNIKKNDSSNNLFITPTTPPIAIGDLYQSTVELYIGFNDKTQWLRFKVKYYGKDSLFVNSYKISADDYQFQSTKTEFEHGNSAGRVWEWIDTPATAIEIEIAKAIANSKKATIQFRGNVYKFDSSISNAQKESIKKILKLYSLMGGEI